MSVIHPSITSLARQIHRKKRPLTFGDFVAGSYRAWGKRKAEGMIRLAIKSHLIEFRGRERFAFS